MTLNSRWPLVPSKGGYNYPDYDPTSTGDHKVMVDGDDVNPNYLYYKVESDGSCLLTDDAHSKVKAVVNLATALPLPDGIASAGDQSDKTSSKGTHVHPLVPPDVHGGKLYTAYVPDVLLRPSVDAVFHQDGGCDPSFFGSYWTEIESGVWENNTLGHMLGGMTDDVAVWVGMRVFAWAGNVEKSRTGIYVIENIGLDPITNEPTKARMRRAPDMATTAQLLHGMYFTVLQGTSWGGMTFSLSTADPVGEIDVADLTWAIIDPPTAAPTYKLLTTGQLSLAASTDNQATAHASASTGEVELQTFTEHDTALGGQTIKAGDPIRFHVPAYLWTDDPYATTKVCCYLRAHAPAGSEPWELVATTQELHNTALGVWVATGTMATDYPIPIGSVLEADYRFISDSVTGIDLNFLYNDATHKSYIEVPLTVGNAGTSYHPDLSGRALPDQHPQRAISIIAKAPTIDGSGNMTPDPSADTVIVPAGATINRIDASQWPSGWGELRLWFPNGGHLVGSQGNSTTFIQITTGNFGGLEGPKGDIIDFDQEGLVHLLLVDGSNWYVDGSYNTGRTT